MTEINEKYFGDAGGKPVYLYEMKTRTLSVGIMTLGATIVSLLVPDKNNYSTDVVLGYDTPQEYLDDKSRYFGATIGRAANRIHGGFSLGVKSYPLPLNDGANCLHGGMNGFDKKHFSATVSGDELIMSYESADGEEGFPEALRLSVRHSLSGGTLTIVYEYEADGDTPVSITNHSYFNLNGGGDILSHEISINADAFCLLDGDMIPILPPVPVFGTPFDFRRAKAPKGLSSEQFSITKYVDHPYLLNGGRAARLYGDVSGIRLAIETTLPSVQLYLGNYVGELRGKGGALYHDYSGVCVEPQYLPNSVNNGYHSGVWVKKGEKRTQEIKYIFG